MISNPWNNLLHVLVEKIIIESLNISFSGSDDVVRDELFGTNFNLLEFITEKSEEETLRPV